MPRVATMRPCKAKVAHYYKYAGLYSMAGRKYFSVVHRFKSPEVQNRKSNQCDIFPLNG